MDSGRRHELEENALARHMRRAPELLWEYGAYALLGVAIVVAVYFYFRNRNLNQVAQTQATAQGLYNMVDAVRDAEQLRLLAASRKIDGETISQQKLELQATFESYAPLAAQSQSAGARSHALRLRGDFAWAMATFPPAPASGSMTQPASRPATNPATFPSLIEPTTQPTTDWLAQAELAYATVLEQYPKQTADNLAALFGLAAIAEERGQFDTAGEFYDQLIARDDVGDPTKNMARQRRSLLKHLTLNTRLAPPRTPATMPTTGPASTQPMSLEQILEALRVPSTAPTTLPASTAPTTQPQSR